MFGCVACIIEDIILLKSFLHIGSDDAFGSGLVLHFRESSHIAAEDIICCKVLSKEVGCKYQAVILFYVGQDFLLAGEKILSGTEYDNLSALEFRRQARDIVLVIYVIIHIFQIVFLCCLFRELYLVRVRDRLQYLVEGFDGKRAFLRKIDGVVGMDS